VIVNALFTSILALLTLLGVAGLVLSLRLRHRAGGTLHGAVRVLAIVEVAFVISVWITGAATGAFHDVGPTSGHFVRLED
jgi:hypothetical protein